MSSITLQCDNCKLSLTLTSNDANSDYFLRNYGSIDKVTGRLFELECPCGHSLKKRN